MAGEEAREDPEVSGLTWVEPDQLEAVVTRWRHRHPDGLVAELRGRRSPDGAALFDEAADALSLPSWFGRNWDALYDVLTDLSWLDRPAYLLVVSDADDLLRESPEHLEVLLTLLDEAAARWADGPVPTPFATLLVSSADTAG